MIITDDIIIGKICGPKQKNIQKKKLFNLDNNYKSYILNRYDDTNDLWENAVRIFKHIDEVPCCPFCNKKYNISITKPKYIERCEHCKTIKREQTMLNKYGYKNTFENTDILNKATKKSQEYEYIIKKQQTCLTRYGISHYTNRQKCAETYLSKTEDEKQQIIEKTKCTKLLKYGNEHYNNINKYKKTCLDNYGVTSPSKLNYIQDKKRQTCLSKYGVEYVTQTTIQKEKSKQTCLTKYGVEYGWNNNTQKETCLNKYGYANVSKSSEIKNKIKETLLIHYGVDSFSKTNQFKQIMIDKHDEIQLKSYNTKKQNHSFNTSKPEDTCYEILKEKYPDVIRQYRDDRYPFNCDFYVPSKDLFIEYQGSWTHGGKPFEGTLNDLLQLQNWCEKNTKYYDNAIYTWTDLDVKKRNIAKQNKLNHVELWNLENIYNLY